MTNDYFCCRVPQRSYVMHCLVTEWKDLCLYIGTIQEACNCLYLWLWNRTLYIRSIWDKKPRFLSFRDEIDSYFSPDRKHILVRCCPNITLSCHAVVWDIARGKEFIIEGFNFVFIYCGLNKGKIASVYWIDKDKFSA